MSEHLYRLLENHPYGGLTSREMADQAGMTIHTVTGLLGKMQRRGIIGRDSETGRWGVRIPNAVFRTPLRSVPGTAPLPPPLRLARGVTPEDLEWMRRAREQGEARRQRKAVARG
ncbi:MAG: hypothetical protein EA420_13285 [Candidatus Competibacteraceae bacterium]|nr:MAG: hypothetical protein EA420_13285 [Candidatus Competibacteraceae bacterium]